MRRRAGRGTLEGNRLRLRHGVRVVQIDQAGEVVKDEFRPAAALAMNIGDAAILAPADQDDDRIALVEIAMIAPDGVLIVEVKSGELPSGGVFVMQGRRVKLPRRPSRKPLEYPGRAIAEMARRVREKAIEVAR